MFDGLTLHQLQCFDAVVTEGSFQAAADKLLRSQPSVSTSVKNLEAQLQLTLLDRSGYIITGPELGPDTRHQSPWTGRHHEPYLLETSLPGVFAAGDVRSGSVKRAAAAVGEGSIAIRFVSEHLGRRTGFATPDPAGPRPA